MTSRAGAKNILLDPASKVLQGSATNSESSVALLPCVTLSLRHRVFLCAEDTSPLWATSFHLDTKDFPALRSNVAVRLSRDSPGHSSPEEGSSFPNCGHGSPPASPTRAWTRDTNVHAASDSSVVTCVARCFCDCYKRWKFPQVRHGFCSSAYHEGPARGTLWNE